jgi:hypothetical protein
VLKTETEAVDFRETGDFSISNSGTVVRTFLFETMEVTISYATVLSDK